MRPPFLESYAENSACRAELGIVARNEPYAASSTGSASRILATFTSRTTPNALRIFSVIQEMSNSYHARPWRADTGCAWWLLCQPSPNVRSATHQLLRESSRVSKRRDPHMCVAELTSQVA